MLKLAYSVGRGTTCSAAGQQGRAKRTVVFSRQLVDTRMRHNVTSYVDRPVCLLSSLENCLSGAAAKLRKATTNFAVHLPVRPPT